MTPKLVNSHSKVFAIIGDPIEHVMSPVIMNYAFQKLGLDNIFIALKCDVSHVSTTMEALRFADLSGYVVTMPLKETVIPLLDEVRGSASIALAVNCIKNEDGRLIGYNTDALGAWSAISEINAGCDAAPVNDLFLFGMGGLSKAVATEAVLHGVRKITAVNRVEEPVYINSFRNLMEKLQVDYPDLRVSILPWEADIWSADLASADVVFNVTPNGLGNNSTLQNEFPYDAVKPDAIFFDAPITPKLAGFLQIAKEKGHRVLTGIDLVVHQGIFALKIFTGESIDYDEMRKAAIDFIQS